jgi:hypothetical protein
MVDPLTHGECEKHGGTYIGDQCPFCELAEARDRIVKLEHDLAALDTLEGVALLMEKHGFNRKSLRFKYSND